MLRTSVVGSRHKIWFNRIVLFFVLTLILTVILAGGQEATGLLAGQVILAQLAPGLAGVILALITSYAVVLYVLVEPISFNIWIAALFHLFINITNVVFLR